VLELADDGYFHVWLNGVDLDIASRLQWSSIHGLNGFQLGSWSGQYPFNGKFDDVRIYNRALNQTEITELAAGTESE